MGWLPGVLGRGPRFATGARMKVIILFLFIIFLLGCQEVDVCPSAMLQVGSDCCDDINNNSICDELEHTATIKDDQEPQFLEQSSITSEILENRIIKAHAPINRLSFSDGHRDNITGIEASFNVRNSSQYHLLKMKKGYNFIQTADDFSEFVQSRSDLLGKNIQIAASSWIDYKQVYYPTWKTAHFNYTQTLEPVDILDKKGFIESHLLVYYTADDNQVNEDLELVYKLNIWCTPEIVVEVYTSPTWSFVYGYDTYWLVMDLAKRKMAEEKSNLIKDAETIAKLCRGEIIEGRLSPGEVVFYGLDGFYPNEIMIKVGEKITIYNQNDRGEGILLKFVREKPRKVILSEVILVGGVGEVVINEIGNYTFFSDQYNGKVKLKVE